MWSCWKQLKNQESWEICTPWAALTALRNICAASLWIPPVTLNYLEQSKHLSSFFFLPQRVDALTFSCWFVQIVIPSAFHDAGCAFGHFQILKWRTQNYLAISSITVKCCLWLKSPLKVISWTAWKNVSSATYWCIKNEVLISAM